jgi:hypothetical protein
MSVACKEVSLDTNAKKIKNMLTSRPKNSRLNHNTKTGNKSFENVSQDIWERQQKKKLPS